MSHVEVNRAMYENQVRENMKLRTQRSDLQREVMALKEEKSHAVQRYAELQDRYDLLAAELRRFHPHD